MANATINGGPVIYILITFPRALLYAEKEDNYTKSEVFFSFLQIGYFYICLHWIQKRILKVIPDHE